ncbi:hypothetical protein DL96DRAFT_1575555 [Flagelloscypha sp. PMI_526]|nr:hypothetical protein DL96DRAFT_1575555 [Flagelloscypha sp. PMI_526]
MSLPQAVHPKWLTPALGLGADETPIDCDTNLIFPHSKLWTCKKQHSVHLTNVVLWGSNFSSAVGLDSTEIFSTGQSMQPVYIDGCWEPKCWNCLTPEGSQIIHRILQRRANAGRHFGPKIAVNMRLETLANLKPPLQLYIRMRRTQVAVFLTDGKNQLTMRSSNREFFVQSLHVATYKLSRRFLRRYQILDLIRSLGAHIPLEERNPNKLIQAVLDLPPDPTYKPSSTARYIYDDGYKLNAHHTPEGLVKTQRRIDHVPRSHMASIFASEAEWLVFNQLAANRSVSQKDKIDVLSWIDFCRIAHEARQKASKSALVWGKTNVNDKYKKNGPDFSQFGRDANWFEDAIAKEQKQQNDNAVDIEDDVDLASEAWHSDESTQYSEISDDPDCHPQNLVIPAHFLRVPELNEAAQWNCPDRGCLYRLDMNNMTEAELDELNDLPFPVQFQQLRADARRMEMVKMPGQRGDLTQHGGLLRNLFSGPHSRRCVLLKKLPL